MEIKIVALIPARLNSKRLINKNFKILCGKEMVDYTIEAAINSGVFDEIILSSNKMLIKYTNPQIKIKFRPEFLCRDDTPMVEVVLWEMRKEPDDTMVCVLQPTSPLRTAEYVKKAIMDFLYEDNYYKSLISRNYTDPLQPSKENGAFFIATIGNIRKLGHWRNFPNIIKFYMPINISVDVNTIEDFKKAEKLLKERKI